MTEPADPEILPFAVTLEVRDRCLCVQAQRLARALARRFDHALKPYGLTNGQFSLLMALNRPAPPRIGQLAEQLTMDRTTLTAALKPLQRRGLTGFATAPKDRREKRPVLTKAGKALLARAVITWRATHDEIDGLTANPAALRDAIEAAARA